MQVLFVGAPKVKIEIPDRGLSGVAHGLISCMIEGLADIGNIQEK